jgi:hypothetical protein
MEFLEALSLSIIAFSSRLRLPAAEEGAPIVAGSHTRLREV